MSLDYKAEDNENEEIQDDVIFSIAESVADDESRTSVINANRLQDMKSAISILRPIAKFSNAKLSYKLHKPFQSMGSISIVGKDIQFMNTQVFYSVAKLASNFEVYPKTDGTVCVTFTFHGLTFPVE